jgi:hypothetical protein
LAVDGDWSSFGSQSEADQSLCNSLCFWCGIDTGRIDQLFRQSALMRDKWNREDYRTNTINNAISATNHHYNRRKSPIVAAKNDTPWRNKNMPPSWYIAETAPAVKFNSDLFVSFVWLSVFGFAPVDNCFRWL